MSQQEAEAAALDDELAALAEPLRQRIDRLDHELASAEALVRILRDNRRRTRDALRYIDPTWVDPQPSRYGPKKKAKTNSKGTSTGYGISDEKVKMVHEWLQSHREDLPPRGITGSQLGRWEDSPLGQEQLAKALRVLHDRGVIRLDHTGTGGSKFYVLV